MTTPWTVRDAEHEDLEPLARLWHDTWHGSHSRFAPSALVRLRTLDSFRERLQATLAIARVVGPPADPLGFCIVRGDELYQLFVTPRAHGSGVAAALLADGEARLAAAGVDTGWLACAIGNDRAARFYEKSGWRRIGTMVNPCETSEGTYPLEVWRYEKRLQEKMVR